MPEPQSGTSVWGPFPTIDNMIGRFTGGRKGNRDGRTTASVAARAIATEGPCIANTLSVAARATPLRDLSECEATTSHPNVSSGHITPFHSDHLLTDFYGIHGQPVEQVVPAIMKTNGTDLTWICALTRCEVSFG